MGEVRLPYGEFPYSIDDKGRVVIPQGFRDFVEDGMVLTRGMEGCLYVFPSNEWKRIEESLENLPLNDVHGRAWVRFFYSGATKVRLDPQGRVSVPQPLRQFAGFEESNDVVVAGFPKRLEIWAQSRWLDVIANIQSQPPMLELLPEPLRGLVG